MKRLLILFMALALLAGAARAEDADEKAMPKGYVRVTTATQSGWLALPIEGEQSLSLPQMLPNGTQSVNVIHLLPDGVYMESSTCANQDCVDEGVVTLDNIKERILGNMIICLPNQVVLELYTPEETTAMLGALPGQAE